MARWDYRSSRSACDWIQALFWCYMIVPCLVCFGFIFYMSYVVVCQAKNVPTWCPI